MKHIDRLPPEEARRRRLISTRKWNRDHRLQKLEANRLVRRDAIDAYGEACACCGESWPIFLAIDHIGGGGSKHRKAVKKSGSSFFYWLKVNNYPPGFQILCHNCNWASYINGICPHQTTGDKYATNDPAERHVPNHPSNGTASQDRLSESDDIEYGNELGNGWTEGYPKPKRAAGA